MEEVESSGGQGFRNPWEFFLLDSKDGVVSSGLIWPREEIWGSHTSLYAMGSKSKVEMGGAQSSMRCTFLHS